MANCIGGASSGRVRAPASELVAIASKIVRARKDDGATLGNSDALWGRTLSIVSAETYHSIAVDNLDVDGAGLIIVVGKSNLGFALGLCSDFYRRARSRDNPTIIVGSFRNRSNALLANLPRTILGKIL